MINLPTVRGLGQFGGFDLYLQDRAGAGREALAAARNQLLGKASENPVLTGVRPNTLADAPQLKLDVDRVQAQAMGLSVSDIYNAVQLMLAPVYVNDFVDAPRQAVYMRSDAAYRTGPESLGRFYTPNPNQTRLRTPTPPPTATQRDDSAVECCQEQLDHRAAVAESLHGTPRRDRRSQAPGHSSGEAMTRCSRFIEEDLPEGFGFDWAGQSYQESFRQPGDAMLLVLSILVVFLCLGAIRKLVCARCGAPGGGAGVLGAVGFRCCADAKRHLLQDRP